MEAQDERLWVGRCDTVGPEGVVLLDADLHDGTGGVSREDYLRNAVQFGVWKKFDRLLVPASDVASIRPLARGV